VMLEAVCVYLVSPVLIDAQRSAPESSRILKMFWSSVIFTQ
jgi:hypothetical protein